VEPIRADKPDASQAVDHERWARELADDEGIDENDPAYFTLNTEAMQHPDPASDAADALAEALSDGDLEELTWRLLELQPGVVQAVASDVVEDVARYEGWSSEKVQEVEAHLSEGF
jgi:hypothetical protein